MNTSIAAHHQRAIDKTIARFRADPNVIAVVLAGSIAKGQQKATSDVDVMIIVEPADHERRRRENVLSECIFDLCDYKGGYIDIKYMSKAYLQAAADHGSEPTRNSFIGTRCVYTRDPSLAAVLASIASYPEHERQDKIVSFCAGLNLNAGFFWWEAVKRNDPYLKTRVVADIVLFGLRLLLAHNRVLFPSHKWLFAALEKCAEKPNGIKELALALLANPTNEAMKAFVESVKNFRDWGVGKDWSPLLTRFIEDNEQWWWNNRPNVLER